MLFATDETFYRVGLFIGPTSNEVVRIKIMWKLFRGYHVNCFYSLLHFIENVGPKISMWASKTSSVRSPHGPWSFKVICNPVLQEKAF